MSPVLGAEAALRPNASVEHTVVDVLYAGSLTQIMETQVAPAFDKATGNHFVGFPGGSKELATKIRSHLLSADVFISASPAVDRTLEGRANGNWLRSFRVFGTTYLEIGYNPASRFAHQLRTKPWFDVIAERGIKVGRTDPVVDPKGVLTVDVLDKASAQHHLPALAALARSTSNVFPEESLLGRLQSGQLDAGFFYQVEAIAAKIPSVPLTGYHYAARYTYAIVQRAPHLQAADAFVRFLTSSRAHVILARDGLGSPS